MPDTKVKHRLCVAKIYILAYQPPICDISVWGGKIEHLILCCHSVKTFAGAKVQFFFHICKHVRHFL